MKPAGLGETELRLMTAVFRRHPEISVVKLFGSRAKGTFRPHSDVDLAVWGSVGPLGAESIAGELDELALPLKFEVQAFEHIGHRELREHIERVGVPIYSKSASSDS
jgi:predicted nucleotidyltransferase